MIAVKNTLPQAKAQTLCREYKQKMLQKIRDSKKEVRQRQQQQEEENEDDSQLSTTYSYANLPSECLETVFSKIEDPYTLGRAALTCTAWRHHATSNIFWQPFMQRTFGKLFACVVEEDGDESEHGFHFKAFSKLATSENCIEMVLPWRTDRIICHDAIRWCSPETRTRVFANAGDTGIAWNENSGVTFLDPQEVVLYLVTRQTGPILEMRKVAPFFEALENGDRNSDGD
jgi:F-box-like